jgi:hypothetical protein
MKIILDTIVKSGDGHLAYCKVVDDEGKLVKNVHISYTGDDAAFEAEAAEELARHAEKETAVRAIKNTIASILEKVSR